MTAAGVKVTVEFTESSTARGDEFREPKVLSKHEAYYPTGTGRMSRAVFSAYDIGGELEQLIDSQLNPTTTKFKKVEEGHGT